MVKFGSLKNVEVKQIRVKDWVWVAMGSTGFFGSLVLIDYVVHM